MTSSIEGVVTSRSREIIMWNRCILCQEKESPIVEKGVRALGLFEIGGSETGAEAGDCGPRDVKRWGSFILTQLYNLTEEEFERMWGDDGTVEGRILSLEICLPCVQLVRDFRSCHEEMQGIRRKMDSMRQVALGKVLGFPLETTPPSAANQEDRIREYFKNVVDILGQQSAATSYQQGQEIYIKDEPPSAEDLGPSPAASPTHFGGESVNTANIGDEETEPCQATGKHLRESMGLKASTSKLGSNSESMDEGAFRGTTFSNPNSHTLDLGLIRQADSRRKNNAVVLDNAGTQEGNVGSAAKKVHPCTVCGKPFKRKWDINRHVRHVHLGEKSFWCVMCNKKFPQYAYLERHMRTHTKERPFACNKCGKAFAQRVTRKDHILTHTKAKFNVCIFCEKGFLQRKQLMSHIRMHTREKGFFCTICHMEFFDSGGLGRHIRIHNSDRAWACQFCSKRFVRTDVLDQHMRVHTRERPFFCTSCRQEFSRLSSLKIHAKRANHSY